MLVPFWYIRALLVIVLLSPVLVCALRRWRWRVLLALLPVYVVCCGVQNRFAMPWFVFYSLLSLTGWVYFSVGVLARRDGWEGRCCRVPTWICWVVALTVICIGRMSLYWGFPGVAGCLWIAGVPPLMLGVWRLVPERQWPAWLVSAAFPVYAMHYFFEHFLEVVVLPLPHAAWWAYVARAGIVAFLSLITATLLRSLMPRESRILFGGR